METQPRALCEKTERRPTLETSTEILNAQFGMDKRKAEGQHRQRLSLAEGLALSSFIYPLLPAALPRRCRRRRHRLSSSLSLR